jgi:hypoxanthine phosphoribosyltransferase
MVSLLSKPSRREVKSEPDYLGFSIEDEFVVGYGLDIDQELRSLPYIGILGIV